MLHNNVCVTQLIVVWPSLLWHVISAKTSTEENTKVLKLSVLSESSGVKSHIAVTSRLADMAPGQVIWKGNNSLQGQKKIKDH